MSAVEMDKVEEQALFRRAVREFVEREVEPLVEEYEEKQEPPLHLFEPRYRALARDVLEGERMIGMVTVRPDRVDDMSGDPPIFPIGCAGLVIEHVV